MTLSARIISGATLAATLVPMSLFAALPVSEPNNGFVSGARPSWSTRHAMSGTEAHKEFHQRANLRMQEFMNDVSDDAQQREGLRAIEQEHRAFHHWKEMKKQRSSSHKNMNEVLDTSGRIGNSPLWNESFTPIFEEFRFEGNRPSRRILEKYTRQGRIR